jgi:hypothetical protein
MIFDEVIDALTDGPEPLVALAQLLDQWGEFGPPCLAMVSAYLDGTDRSERTERALFFLVHALAEKGETRVFAGLCHLLSDGETADLLFGDATAVTIPSVLINLFDGDPAPLQRLIETANGDESLRGDGLLVLAYLTRTKRLSDAWMMQYLTDLPARLQPPEEHFVWFGWARAVAALGYAGLAAQVESVIGHGLIPPDLLTSRDFWDDLRESQADPGGLSARCWDGIGPLDDAVAALQAFDSEPGDPEPVQQPIVNPLRHIGRNDPCPCGSGRKYKKCCLAA